jgi:hypothetical protein
MRLLPLCTLLLTGCGYDLIGRWELTSLTVGEETIDDAGFLDLAEGSAARVFEPNVYLVRYRLNDTGALVPDPSPEVRQASIDLDAVRDDDPDAALRLDFPGLTGDFTTALKITERTPGQLLLDDPDFAGGAGMIWYLER